MLLRDEQQQQQQQQQHGQQRQQNPRGRPSNYRTAPLPTRGLPPGISYIIVNECAERFSYYGMKAILTIFLTQHLGIGEAAAREYYHAFTTAAFFFPVVGAMMAEVFLGKYRTVIGWSLVYCAGHLALALNDSFGGLVFGLTLIAIGAGGIKPCVSAILGDQFCHSNQALMSRAFAWFYLSINVGSFVSTLITPALLSCCGPHYAFGLPGVLMGVATLTFWLGRHSYAHIPPHGRQFLTETCSRTGLRALRKLLPLFLFFSAFWSLYDQTGSAWVTQATQMDRNFLGVEWLASQVASVNALLILILVPVFNGVIVVIPHCLTPRGVASAWEAAHSRVPCDGPALTFRLPGLYDLVARVVRVTPLRKIGTGLFLLALSFAIPLQIETRIAAGERPSIGWQLLAYVVLTAAEVLVSITGLEFSYSQAPPKMKSAVMALFLLSTSLGNAFTTLVNVLISNPDGTSSMSDVQYYSFFIVLMLVVALAYVPFAMCYQERTYLQDGLQDGGPSRDITESPSAMQMVSSSGGEEDLPVPSRRQDDIDLCLGGTGTVSRARMPSKEAAENG